MGKMIAVAGKGGTGKTTISALVVRYLLQQNKTPIFAIDADPNYTLGDALGIEVEQTIGMMREEFIGERDQIPAGMSKEAVLERSMHAALHERSGVDLLVMGRQEGPGCYCYLNNILRRFMDMLADDYRYVMVDNEAGMEHLSRRTTRKVDLMFVVSDASVKGVKAADRIVGLIDELKLDVRQKYLILNRVRGEITKPLRDEIGRTGLEVLVELPDDPAIAEADANGRALLELPDDAACIHKLQACLDRLLSK